MMRALAVALVLIALGVRAETVRVMAGDSVTGEGWTYADGGECYVVTARHVVVQGGRATLPLLVNAAGIEGQGVEPALPPDTLRVGGEPMDAARFRVIGALSTHCGDDLGYENLSATLARVKDTGQALYISKVLPHGSEEIVPAAVIALNKDGDRFTLRPASGADAIVQSDSGSPVRLRGEAAVEQGLPLGLVTDSLGDGTALVLRMDAIRRWVTASRAESVGAAGGAGLPLSVVAWSGETPDPACGPANLLDAAAACGWRAHAARSAATVDLDLAVGSGSAPVSEVRLTLEPGARLSGMEVLVPDEQGWQSVRYCPAAPGAAVQSCAFLPRIAKAVRLRLAGFAGGVRKVEVR
ncbi:MAG: hypothetical protein JO157_14225 [Acetobacteraceae bacterium]|nr:hypothetical protein [Acetobacteraceae bacterium]